MLLKGKVMPGPMRGEGLMEHFHYRIVHTLGFEPYKGTLDIKIEHDIRVGDYATKTIDHVILDGRTVIDAYLCPVTIRKGEKSTKAWIIRKSGEVFSKSIVEIISKERIKDELDIKNGDEVELEIPGTKVKKSERKKHFAKRFRRMKQDIPHIVGSDTTLMKR
ncbi:MAG: DUF120 domain-containing protein [Candidatus Aenigmarchaeota archaeon]|nr:DUF120 domain-containing protein [Candidatus Aenigmarchaeota archaeon]